MQSRIFSFHLAIAALLLSACGTATDPTLLDGDSTSAKLALSAISSPSTIVAKINDDRTLAPDNSGVVFTAARVNLRDVKLDLPDGKLCEDINLTPQDSVKCENDDDSSSSSVDSSGRHGEIEISGPFVFNLLTGLSSPDLGTFQIPSGVYRRADFRIDEAKMEDGLVSADDDLLNHSFVAVGTVSSSSGSHPLKIRLKFNEDIRIESAAGVEVPENSVTSISARFNIEQWFVGIDLGSCLDRGDLILNGSGELIITDDMSASGDCDDVENDLKDAIKKSIRFDGHDDDTDDESGDDHGANHS